jgi:hypothetical protein
MASLFSFPLLLVPLEPFWLSLLLVPLLAWLTLPRPPPPATPRGMPSGGRRASLAGEVAASWASPTAPLASTFRGP